MSGQIHASAKTNKKTSKQTATTKRQARKSTTATGSSDSITQGARGTKEVAVGASELQEKTWIVRELPNGALPPAPYSLTFDGSTIVVPTACNRVWGDFVFRDGVLTSSLKSFAMGCGDSAVIETASKLVFGGPSEVRKRGDQLIVRHIESGATMTLLSKSVWKAPQIATYSAVARPMSGGPLVLDGTWYLHGHTVGLPAPMPIPNPETLQLVMTGTVGELRTECGATPIELSNGSFRLTGPSNGCPPPYWARFSFQLDLVQSGLTTDGQLIVHSTTGSEFRFSQTATDASTSGPASTQATTKPNLSGVARPLAPVTSIEGPTISPVPPLPVAPTVPPTSPVGPTVIPIPIPVSPAPVPPIPSLPKTGGVPSPLSPVTSIVK